MSSRYVYLLFLFDSFCSNVAQKADSKKEEVKILKTRCNLLGSSIVNTVKGKDAKLLSEDLKDSIGRLLSYVKFFGYSVKHSKLWL